MCVFSDRPAFLVFVYSLALCTAFHQAPGKISLQYCCVVIAHGAWAKYRNELTLTNMPLPTTVIGSYPKPDYLCIPDWFRTKQNGPFIKRYNETIKSTDAATLQATIQRAIQETLDVQDAIGIEVVTDGEIQRVSYIHHFCRRVKGIDFEKLMVKSSRNGACIAEYPTIVSRLEAADEKPWVHIEWKESQDKTKRTVKITLPGPLTIINSLCDQYYNNDLELSRTLVRILNREIRALAESGCKYIQVDEPVLVRSPDTALQYGIDHLVQCFDGVPSTVSKCIHLCCGYPLYLDQTDYMKADPGAYLQIVDKLDAAGFDYIAIEDAHRHNDLELFKRFKKSKLIVGAVKIASSKVESVQEIKTRLQQILTVLSADRLVVSPDCGLGFLPPELAVQKLKNMVEAAKSLP